MSDTHDGLTEYTITCETALNFLVESPVGHAVIATDGKFLWVNEAYCLALNARREQVLGTTWMKWTHQDDLTLDFELANKVRLGEIRQYRMVKKYKQLGHSEHMPRIVVGALIVFGNFDDDGNFINYRVTFDAYVPDQSDANKTVDYEKWLRVLADYLFRNYRTVLAILITLVGLILGNSERLSEILRDTQQLKNELEQSAYGSSSSHSSPQHGRSQQRSDPQESPKS